LGSQPLGSAGFVVEKLRERFDEGKPWALAVMTEKAPNHQVQLDLVAHTRQIVWVTQVLGMDFAAHFLTARTFRRLFAHLDIDFYSFIIYFNLLDAKTGFRWKKYVDHISAVLLLEI
jgi:hypothetical protein